MSTSKPDSPLSQALSGVDGKYLKRLVMSYEDLKRNHADGKYEPAGLNAGKFCEIVIRLLQKAVLGQATPFNQRITNFADECSKLIRSPSSSAVESLRITIPRALVFMYTVRNKRGIGHVGGDVEANQIDSTTLARMSDWIMSELVRVYHGVSLEEAQELVDMLASRNLPHVWKVGGKKRILKKGLSSKEQVLLLLYTEPGSFVLAEDLCDWVEYKQFSMFKRNVLRPLHKNRLVEFDEECDAVFISPLGASEVEKHLL